MKYSYHRKIYCFYFPFCGQSIQNTGFVSSSDMILAKFNPAGSLWSRLRWDGSYTNEEGVKVVCDSSGNYYCAGQFDGPSFLIDTSFAKLAINGTKDIFLKNQPRDGHSIWIKHFGGQGMIK
ncbi:MAG: hypothetical protein IPJ66_14285 [Bacteroidetes bacterium]|nr:hypothetical protein [Bacteroidota bacterium]